MYLYLIKAGKYFKIGVSKNPEGRLRQIQTGNSQKCRLFDKIKCDSKYAALNMEKTLHGLFSDYKMNGEWFEIKRSDFDQQIQRLLVHKPDWFSHEYKKAFFQSFSPEDFSMWCEHAQSIKKPTRRRHT